MIKAEWKHKRHFCDGEWSLVIDDVDFTMDIPVSARYGPMNTNREYVFWTLDYEQKPVWVRGYYGEPLPLWLTTHPWVKRIVSNAKEKGLFVTEEALYEAFMKNDFMRASCGECLLKDQRQYKQERRDILKDLPDPEKFLTPEELYELHNGIARASEIRPVGFNAQRRKIEHDKKFAKKQVRGTYHEY